MGKHDVRNILLGGGILLGLYFLFKGQWPEWPNGGGNGNGGNGQPPANGGNGQVPPINGGTTPSVWDLSPGVPFPWEVYRGIQIWRLRRTEYPYSEHPENDHVYAYAPDSDNMLGGGWADIGQTGYGLTWVRRQIDAYLSKYGLP